MMTSNAALEKYISLNIPLFEFLWFTYKSVPIYRFTRTYLGILFRSRLNLFFTSSGEHTHMIEVPSLCPRDNAIFYHIFKGVPSNDKPS
jgi:hypothetical protein